MINVQKLLNPNVPEVTRTVRNEVHARAMQDQTRRLRVGDPMSPVLAGDPTPNGGFYKQGQYAPHVEDLAEGKLSSALDQGILPRGLPILNDEGEVDKDLISEWDPNEEGIPAKFADDVPPYSSLIVASVINSLPKGLVQPMDISVMNASRYAGEFGNFIIACRTNSMNRKFYSTVYVYPDFFKFIDKPLVPKNPVKDYGVSVSTFMTFHTIGHILMSKLSFDGRLQDIANFMASSGWSKTPDAAHEKAWFLGRKATSAWYRDFNHKFLSELSKYSPLDDFAQAFAFYYSHEGYLKFVDPQKYEIMDKIIKEHMLI